MAIPNQRILTTIDSVASSPRDSSACIACIESFYSDRTADARRPAPDRRDCKGPSDGLMRDPRPNEAVWCRETPLFEPIRGAGRGRRSAGPWMAGLHASRPEAVVHPPQGFA